MSLSKYNALTQRSVHTRSVNWNVIDTNPAAADDELVDVYLHGTGSSTHTWLPLLQHSVVPRRTLLLDLPGHARSHLKSPPVQWPANPMASPLSLPAMTRALAELLETLNVKVHTLVGHSAGAAIACQLCLNHKVSAANIISLNGALAPLDGLPGILFSPIARFSAASGWASRFFSKRLQDTQQIDRLLQNTGSTLPEAQRQYYVELCHNEQHVTAALRMMASWDLKPLYQQLPKLTVPVLWVAGENDRMIPPKDADQLQRMLPSSQTHLVKATGHLMHEERPDLIAPLIAELRTNSARRYATPASHNTTHEVSHG